MEYQFDVINEQVKISPMRSLFCERIIKSFARGVDIKPNCCFTNAVITAEWFQEHGFDVEVAEGRLVAKSQELLLPSQKVRLNTNPIEHRWCKKGEKYFDPTIECLYGYEMTKTWNYDAIRLYESSTLRDYAEEIERRYGVLKFCDSISGFTYAWVGNEDVPINWGRISDSFDYVVPEENPVFVRDELLRLAAG